jgi:apoptosis-inducing factor 3
MAQERSPSSGPDLTQGVTLAEFLDGKLAGHVGGQEVLLVHSGTEIFAVAAHCTHYHGRSLKGS